MIYISHRLEELPAIADRVTVLRDGQTIETRKNGRASAGTLIRLMVGRELSAVFPKRAVERGDVIFELEELGCTAAGIRRYRSRGPGRRDRRRRGADRSGPDRACKHDLRS